MLMADSLQLTAQILTMKLNITNLSSIDNSSVLKPQAGAFDLPEKVLQFGTGVLLRGLPDYFIDKANRQGIFNGRVVVVKSTDAGGTDAFEEQDGLYTLCVRGINQGAKVEENIVSSAISRVLSAKNEWHKIIACAADQAMQIIISNTTEVGIQYTEEKIDQQPPASFPGKLLAFLHARYLALGQSTAPGMVIVPTELIVGNADKLKSIVLQLAAYNNLDETFMQWLKNENSFCNSLVDRIVPGKPEPEMLQQITEQTAYEDDLLIMSEVYRLWAIEGDEKVKQVLSFAQADEGVIITPDIEKYRELKLRLLNGTHTLSCGLAFLSGFTTVKEAMADAAFGNFVEALMLQNIAPAIPGNVTAAEAESFGRQVLDRFRNPYLNHQWISITMQYTSKMKMRVVPVLVKYIKEKAKLPEYMVTGFAAYLLFMKATGNKDGKYSGEHNGKTYPVNDDKAAYFYEAWQKYNAAELVEKVLSDTSLWDIDLTTLPQFKEAVQNKLVSFQQSAFSGQ